MKASEIVIGEKYWTRVSGVKTDVRVIRATTVTVMGGKMFRQSFIVQRLDNDKILSKSRSAASLHPLDWISENVKARKP
jgi:hypothetical protein